jgi:hypothetical protein
MIQSLLGYSDKRRGGSCETQVAAVAVVVVVVVVVVAVAVAVAGPWPRSKSWASVEATCVFASGSKECPLRMIAGYGHGQLCVSVTC